ncbi:MAG TPA: response regulator [Armatimonadota bacterium]|nr:response regulator [Armatimonadota bacterium]
MAVTIMIIEDDEELNEVMQYNLTQAGYRVVQEWDGLKAKEAIRESPPDLLLLDIMLPGIDGWEICKWLSETPDLQKIPILFFTAKGAREDYDRARQYNMAGYFTKPYGTADVLRHIEKVVASRIASDGG